MTTGTTATDFDAFMQQRESVSNDYIRGDARGVSALCTDREPATFMPPSGAVVEGATAARTAQVDGAAAFGPGSHGRFEVLSSGADGDLAYWTGRQVATMDVKGQDRPVEMVLRTTEVFRREDGRWRLAHRHADIPADGAG